MPQITVSNVVDSEMLHHNVIVLLVILKMLMDTVNHVQLIVVLVKDQLITVLNVKEIEIMLQLVIVKKTQSNMLILVDVYHVTGLVKVVVQDKLITVMLVLIQISKIYHHVILLVFYYFQNVTLKENH